MDEGVVLSICVLFVVDNKRALHSGVVKYVLLGEGLSLSFLERKKGIGIIFHSTIFIVKN